MFELQCHRMFQYRVTNIIFDTWALPGFISEGEQAVFQGTGVGSQQQNLLTKLSHLIYIYS
jgi:hypothetical protein